MSLRLVIGDYETFYSPDIDEREKYPRAPKYSVKPMGTEAYVRDPRFEAHGKAVKWSPNHQARWYPEKEWRYLCAQEDWSDVFMIHHHSQFDSLIDSHHYKVFPKMIGCTMSMARLVLGAHVSASLDSVRQIFGIPPKTTPYNLFRNKHWHDLTPREQELVGEGACDEVESVFLIFQKLMRGDY